MSEKKVVRSEGTAIWALDDGTPQVWRKVPVYRCEVSNHGEVRKRVYTRTRLTEEEKEDPNRQFWATHRRTKRPIVYRDLPRFPKAFASPSTWVVYPWRTHKIEVDLAELVWRGFYESWPPGYTIAFRDGDPSNVMLHNLKCVRKKKEE